MANVTSAIKARSLSAPLDGGRNPPKPPPQQSIMDIMKRQRLKGEAKDKTIEGIWYDEIDIDEAFDLLRKFRKMHMFFDDYSDDDFIHLSDVMDILKFKAEAPVTKEGELSTWVGFILSGKINVLVKGTQVAVMKPGSIIGDTGYVEGGKRSADLFGAEGGGIIALLPFDKLDLLYETHSRLAYKLAVSFGGAVVQKLRITLGKVYQKDNVARAGTGIGRRRINDTRIGFARDASYLETLTQKEVLYIAKMKKMKKPERERKLKEKRYKEKIEKENKGLRSQLKGCRQELNDYVKREEHSKYLLSITTAALMRYERLYIDAYPIVQKFRLVVPELRSQIEELKEKLADSEKARRDKFGDLEDSLVILKQKEKTLLEQLHVAKRNEKLIKTRLKSTIEKYEESEKMLRNKILGLQDSFERVDVTMNKQEMRIKNLNEKLARERAMSMKLERSWKIKGRWQSGVVKALSKRIHTVRRVAKVHNAWWKQLNHVNLLRFKKMDEMIADWQARDDQKKKLLKEANEKIVHINTQWIKSKKQLAGMTFAGFSLLLKACKNNDLYGKAMKKIQEGEEKNAQLKLQMEETTKSMKKVVNVAKFSQKEAYNNASEIVLLKAQLTSAEKDIAWKDLEMYKLNESNRSKRVRTMEELRTWRGALDTRTMEVKSNKDKVIQLQNQLNILFSKYEKSENRRIKLENRFGHLLPDNHDNNDGISNQIRSSLENLGGSSIMSVDFKKSNTRQRPRTAHSLNISFGSDGNHAMLSTNSAIMPELSMPETSNSILPSPMNNAPPYYPQHDHRLAQPNYQLGSSKTMSYYDNARNREKNGIVGTPKISSKLILKYQPSSSSQIKKGTTVKLYREKRNKLATRKLPTISKSLNNLPTLSLKLPNSPTTEAGGDRKMNSPLQGFENVY